ncbi:MAG TPA: PDGLE domain-containing protein [Actinomycetota bacterium]
MRREARYFVIGGLLVAAGLAMFVSPFASGSPDGLERVSIDQRFDGTAAGHALEGSPVAGYGVRGVGNDRVSAGLAGLVGTLVTFGVGSILFGAVVRANARRSAGGRRAAAAEAGVAESG